MKPLRFLMTDESDYGTIDFSRAKSHRLNKPAFVGKNKLTPLLPQREQGIHRDPQENGYLCMPCENGGLQIFDEI